MSELLTMQGAPPERSTKADVIDALWEELEDADLLPTDSSGSAERDDLQEKLADLFKTKLTIRQLDLISSIVRKAAKVGKENFQAKF